MERTIRKIQSVDRDLFLAMSREFYRTPGVLHDIPDEFRFRTFEEMTRSDLYLDGRFLLLNGVEAGYVLLTKSFSQECGGAVVWVDELYVRPEFQGQGLAGFFFRWLEQNFSAARYRLELEPGNTRAEALYRRMGYTPLPYTQMIKEKTDSNPQPK